MLYLDYAASTPVDERVKKVMLSHLTEDTFANPSSGHWMGRKAKQVIDNAREHVANLIGCDNSEIVWTSGATESNNLAIRGVVSAYQYLGKHIITLKTEHESVLQPCQQLEKFGFEVTYLTPQKNGLIDIDELEEKITSQTILITAMLVNNETGVIQKIEAISDIARNKGIVFHVDAAQGVGKIPLDVKKMKIDLMSFSAHKMYGPKGVGALYVNKQDDLELQPILYGGRQEYGLRPGTLATHQITAFGEACRIAKQEMSRSYAHAENLRDAFIKEMRGYIKVNFPVENALPNIMSIFFNNISDGARERLQKSEKIVLSTRSACSSYREAKFSHVLQALGFDESVMNNTFRISTGKYTTRDEITLAANIMKKIIEDEK